MEDDYGRLQERLYRMFGTAENGNLFFSVSAKQLGSGLDEQLTRFLREHPDTSLIIIDTLQKVREVGGDNYSYANDYQIITRLKTFADTYGICLMVVHHTRKQKADDAFDMISGTNGLMGGRRTALSSFKKKNARPMPPPWRSPAGISRISGCTFFGMEQKLASNPEYQLPEPQAFMTAKSYKAKFAEPLINKLKKIVKSLIVQCAKAWDNYHRINERNGRLYKENEHLIASNDRLREENTTLRDQNKDYSLLRKVFGSRQIDNLVAQAKEAQQAKRLQRQRSYDYER